MDYSEFLETKAITASPVGMAPSADIHPKAFPFQRDIIKWSLKRGRSALWADCGLGKSLCELEWSRQIAKATKKRVLIVAPLAVSHQHVREGEKWDIALSYAKDQSEVWLPITVTNYERLEKFDPTKFIAICLDESSILKNLDGKTRNLVIDMFRETPYKLAATATPSPNDYMELGNHAEFLGVMKHSEMLSMFFVHDGGDTSKWRLKGHAQSEFWKWLCSWAVMLRKPSDLGYSDEGFELPPLITNQITVESRNCGEHLFPMEAKSLRERISARKDSVQDRVQACVDLVLKTGGRWIIWCGLNSEQEAIEAQLKKAISIYGRQKADEKEALLIEFLNGDISDLLTKPSICGLGLNLQHIHNVAFVGVNDSWEDYYQAVRRCWRFGQTQPVNVWLIVADTEGDVVRNLKRKDEDAQRLASEMVKHMQALNTEIIKGTEQTKDEYTQASAPHFNDGWEMINGDCVEAIGSVSGNSIDYTIFSPPFASLYTYSASERDMGNCRTMDEFQSHFAYLVKELYRVTKPGRALSFHCMNLPTTITHHGYIGQRDFRGDLIRMFQDVGFILHSEASWPAEIVIWKDPVTAMQRTHAMGLLYKELCKDSIISRQGIPDYLITMRKPGKNEAPIPHSKDTADALDVAYRDETNKPVNWQQWASPIWMDINPGDTLNFRSVREEQDERHICPLQLEVIRRALSLWSNPGDLVLSPFAGIGSEGYIALGGKTQVGATLPPRRFVGIELKESYFKQACSNCEKAVKESKEGKLL